MTALTPAQAARLTVVAGPSGVGKSTIVREVLERTGAAFSVSMTTRPPRAGETDGREYRFVDRATFEQRIREGRMLEWAEVYGELYGTEVDPVARWADEGRPVVLEIDVQGARQVHQHAPQASFVFVLPPSDRVLTERLTGRGTEAGEKLQRRLQAAREEIRHARDCGVFEHFVINDDLERAIRQVVEIVES